MANDKTPKEAQPAGKIWLGDIIGGGRGGAGFSESSVDEIAEAVARDIRDERIPAMTGEEAALMDKMITSIPRPEITEASEDILRQMADEGEKGGGKDISDPRGNVVAQRHRGSAPFRQQECYWRSCFVHGPEE